MGCSEQIVRLLLQHAARVDAVNADGQTPLMLLSLQPSSFLPSFFDFAEDASRRKRQWSLDVAKLLIDAEADPISSDRNSLSCVQLASQARNTHLVRLYRGEHDADANNEMQDSFASLDEMHASANASQLPWARSAPPLVRITGA